MVLKEKDFESVMNSALGGINGATSIFSPGANSNKQQNNQINNTINTYQNINCAIYDYVNSIKENFQTDINIESNKTKITIDGQNYIVEFDTVLRDNDQKHFRLERIYLLEEVTKNRLLRPARLKINQ